MHGTAIACLHGEIRCVLAYRDQIRTTFHACQKNASQNKRSQEEKQTCSARNAHPLPAFPHPSHTLPDLQSLWEQLIGNKGDLAAVRRPAGNIDRSLAAEEVGEDVDLLCA